MDRKNPQREASESAGLRLVSDQKELTGSREIETQFVNFMFFRVSPEWRRLDADPKAEFKRDFITKFDRFRRDFLLFTYSLVGFDSKADLMFWRIGNSLDLIQEMTACLYRTKLGSFFETTDNYLSVTKKMMFVSDGPEDRTHTIAGEKKYHFIYPCLKCEGWYQMSSEERESMIEENFMVGRRFQNMKIYLTRTMGFSEQEYIISIETDEPRDFLALAEELRQTPASKYSIRGMPVYTCRQRGLAECLDALG